MEKELLPRSISLQEFVPLVGRAIHADCSPETVELRLVEATPLPDRGDPTRPPFILIFQSEPMIQLMAGTYAMKAEHFGPDLIHIEPVAPTRDAPPGNYYQAVFN